MLNADLASGCDVVIVVSCFAPDVARPIKNPNMAALQCRLDFGGGHRTWLAQALQEAGAIRPAWGS